MPSLLASAILTGFTVFAMDSKQVARHGRIDAPDVGILSALIYAIFGMMVSLPAAIISYRCVTVLSASP